MSDLLNDFINQCASDSVNARPSDPETSWAAAASVKGVGEKRQAVLTVLRHNPGGLSDDRILVAYRKVAPIYGFPQQSDSGIRSRRSELVTLGLVRDSGRRSKTPSGRSCVVWEAV